MIKGERALIGHTGLVGSTLDAQDCFDARFNSKNIEDVAGRHFAEIVCCGIQSVKWWANANPELDWAGILRLCKNLDVVSADVFTLVSTVDVYPTALGVTETSPIADEGQPYGRHRRLFELFAMERFPETLIVRLPGVFGAGLKKNLIFDVLAGSDLSGFDSASTFQFYPLDRLSADIRIARSAGLPVINVAVAPVTVAAVIEAMTGMPWGHDTSRPRISYDMQTEHAALWGRSGPYIMDEKECLAEIARFAKLSRATPASAEACVQTR